jgi:hypothetical protein
MSRACHTYNLRVAWDRLGSGRTVHSCRTVNLSDIHDKKRDPYNRKAPHTVVSRLSETSKQARKSSS